MPPLGVASWLVACRNSLGMTQSDLAKCIYKEDKFPPTPQAQMKAILTEIEQIEKYDTWTYADQALLTFWANAFVCLHKADPWAKHGLSWNVLKNIP